MLGSRPEDAGLVHRHGRPLLITANDHRLGLANGDLGVLWETDGRLSACFPDGAGGVRRLAPARLPAHETGWVTTVHKAQGSEAVMVVAVLPPAPHPLANRELVYTAVTRARERVLLVGDAPLLAAALMRREQRRTGLAACLSA
jgi:exodeoxyribonuclease V alpha subunit